MRRAYSVAAVGVLAALFCAAAFITIPFPFMPLTLQCFAVALGAYVFGAKSAVSAVIIYGAAGAVGLPVFAGAQGGAQVLFGPTGGFVWGFLALALCCGVAKGKSKKYAFILGLLGLTFCYASGTAQYAAVTGLSFGASFFAVGALYILKDAVLVLLAQALSVSIISALNKAKKCR